MVETHIPNNRSLPSNNPREPFPTRRSLRSTAPVVARTARPVAAYSDDTRTDTGAIRIIKARRRSIQQRVVALATVVLVPGILIGTSIPASAFGTGASTAANITDAGSSQTLIVDTALDGTAFSRDTFGATTPEELAAAKQAAIRQASRAAAGSTAATDGEYSSVAPRAAGDDYPYRSGGGLSPMGYVIRQCTDFVAWRLNRDAGATSNYKYVWAKMTPNGGSASEWASAWRNNGWKTSHTPVKGAVAWFAGNHVAYVKSIDGGQVNLEEYNWGGDASYHTRTIDASDVALFLYPPP